MQPLIAFNLWKWVEENRHAFEPPVGNKVVWWFCDRCDGRLHEVTMHVADIERELKAAIEAFDQSALRTCRGCGHVHPEQAPAPEKP